MNKTVANAHAALLFMFFLCLAMPVQENAAPVPKNQAAANTQAFTTYTYIDPATKLQVFSMLVPKGWKVDGTVTWSADPALPAQSRFQFYNPAGPEKLNFFPTRAWFWTNNRLFLTTNPPGTVRLGTRVASPVDLHYAFTELVLPGAGRNKNGVRIVREEKVPELAKLARGEATPGVAAYADAGKMRVTYQENGTPMEEEFYAAVSQFIINMPASPGNQGYFLNYWYIDYVFSFRDRMGALNAHSKLFQTMLYSLKFNPQWVAKFVNVKEMLTQQYIRGINATGRMGQMIAQAGSRMREDQQRSWEARQAANDRIVQNFSDNIRGVERYTDPRAGKEVELPAGYGNAWANDLGEYIVSESQSYNPNLNSTQHWERLEPAR
jgi:hypothetical protein